MTTRASGVALLLLLSVAVSACGDGEKPSEPLPKAGASIELQSPAFRDGGAIPASFTCDGKELSPPLRWSGVPPRARELALVVEDSDAARFVQVQHALERVFVDPRLLEYAVALVAATRADASLAVGASPRGSLALVKLARAWALLAGRDYVGPDDVRAVAIPALAHRVVVTDETWARGTPASDLVRRVLDRVPAPSVA